MMAERQVEKVERVTYTLSADEVRGRILTDLIDDVGIVFNEATKVTILADGSCTVVTEYPSPQTPQEQS